MFYLFKVVIFHSYSRLILRVNPNGPVASTREKTRRSANAREQNALRRKSSMCSVGRDRASAERSLGGNGCGLVLLGNEWNVRVIQCDLKSYKLISN